MKNIQTAGYNGACTVCCSPDPTKLLKEYMLEGVPFKKKIMTLRIQNLLFIYSVIDKKTIKMNKQDLFCFDFFC